MSKKEFTTEQLEQIRILAGDKIITLVGAIKNLKNDTKVNEVKRAQKLAELEGERADLERINNKALFMIAKKIR